jgi:hypothetical protein
MCSSAPVLCACAARFGDTLLERFAGAEHSNTSVAGRQSLCSANAFTGVPPTSMAWSASAYSGLRVVAHRDTHAQISPSHPRESVVHASRALGRMLRARVQLRPAAGTRRWPRFAAFGRTTG